MNDGPLISARELAQRLGEVSVLDVRWELGRGAVRDAYLKEHVPGAAFVDLDVDLSAPAGDGGRHPLPDPRAFQTAMRTAGICNQRPVVVYDQATSSAAARAWWLLRYYGHRDVRVLDGGLAAWSGDVEGGEGSIEPGDFSAEPGAMPLVDVWGAAELSIAGVLIDARSAERFRGEVEPVDAVAGHIPGAVNRPTTQNVEADGRFKDPESLRAAFTHLGVVPGETTVAAYCGSGVTAAHEVLALELAGFEAALYPGSWSEWIRDPDRPVAKG